MFCQKCGSKSIEGSVFCQKCGEKLIFNDVTQQTDVPITSSVPTNTEAMKPQESNNQSNKKKPKKFLTIIGGIVGLFFLILLIGIFGESDTPTSPVASENSSSMQENTQFKSESTDAINLSQTYTNEVEGLTFQYPEAWKILSNAEMNDFYGEDITDIVIVCLASNRDKPEIASFISVSKFQSSKAEIDEMFSSTEEYFENGFMNDMIIHDLSDMYISGFPVRKLAYTVDYGVEITGIRYYYAIDTMMYRVDFECRPNTLESLEKVFNAIIESYIIMHSVDETEVSNSYPSEILYNGDSVSQFFGHSADTTIA